MFCGRFSHSIDAKGRTALPARFREVLQNPSRQTEQPLQLVLTTGLDRCLVAYPMDAWAAFQQRLASLPHFDPEVRTLQRLYVSAAVEITPDKLGRFVIPSELRSHAGLEGEALWAGMGAFAELWSRANFDALTRDSLDDPDKKAKLLSRLSELGI